MLIPTDLNELLAVTNCSTTRTANSPDRGKICIMDVNITLLLLCVLIILIKFNAPHHK